MIKKHFTFKEAKDNPIFHAITIQPPKTSQWKRAYLTPVIDTYNNKSKRSKCS